MHSVLVIVGHGQEEVGEVGVGMHVYSVPEKCDISPSGMEPVHPRAEDAHHVFHGRRSFHVLGLEPEGRRPVPINGCCLEYGLMGLE